MDQPKPNESRRMIKKLFSEKNLHTYFNAGVLIKAIDSIGEIAIGLFLYLDPQLINRIIIKLFGDELSETPRDPITHFFLHNWNGYVSGSERYVFAFLFLGHGIAKILLVLGLSKNKLWVYPTATVVFASFASYQMYQIILSPSLLLGAYTILDILFCLLIMYEFQYKRKQAGLPIL